MAAAEGGGHTVVMDFMDSALSITCGIQSRVQICHMILYTMHIVYSVYVTCCICHMHHMLYYENMQIILAL